MLATLFSHTLSITHRHLPHPSKELKARAAIEIFCFHTLYKYKHPIAGSVSVLGIIR